MIPTNARVTPAWLGLIATALVIAALLGLCRPQIAPTPDPPEATPVVVTVLPTGLPSPATATVTPSPYAPFDFLPASPMPTATNTPRATETPVPPISTETPIVPMRQRG